MRAFALVTAVTLGAVRASAEQFSWLGQVFPPSADPTLPLSTAFFPLTDGAGDQLAAYPGGIAGLANFTVDWTPDSPFGSVLPCNKSQSDAIFLDPVSYGLNGSFALSFWFKADPANDAGTLFGYMFSTTANATSTDLATFASFAPNTINVYLPESGHPAAGLVRTVVKDSTDLGNVQTYLDSDGMINDDNNRTSPIYNVSDGNWHQYTLTTHYDLTDGFTVYVDGNFAGDLSSASAVNQVDGGQPIYLNTADIFLCSRSDEDTSRYFSGSLANLAIWNEPLTAAQVSALYNTVPRQKPGIEANGTTMQDVVTWSGRQCVFPYLYLGTDTYGCIQSSNGMGTNFCFNDERQWTQCSLDTTLAWSSLQTYVDNFINNTSLAQSEEHVQLCAVNGSLPEVQLQSCGLDYECAALPSWAANQTLGENTTTQSFNGTVVGVCANWTGIFPVESTNLLPPTYYFPLTDSNPSTWPLPQYNFSGQAPNASWVYDSLFGSVYQCGEDNSLTAQNLTWGASGPFALNLWFKQDNDQGDLFQYLLSVRNESLPTLNATTIFDPNEVHLYLPEAQHPAEGLVRAIVKDSTNTYMNISDQVWLDSDGYVSDDNFRASPRMNFTDGQWHMLTLTTLPSGSAGYQIYVDGIWKAELNTTNAPLSVADVGQPIYAGGTMVLCGRSDYGASRFFDGRVAQLSIYDYALSNTTIGALYKSIMGVLPIYVGAPPPPGPAVDQTFLSLLPAEAPDYDSASAPIEETIIIPLFISPSSADYESPSEEQEPLLPGFINYSPPPSPTVLSILLSETPPALPSQSSPASPPPAAVPSPPPAPETFAALNGGQTQASQQHASQGHGGHHLSDGAVAGIVVAAVVGALAIGGLATFFFVRRKPSWERHERMREDNQGGRPSGGFGDPAKVGVQMSDANLGGKHGFLSSHSFGSSSSMEPNIKAQH
ncbi:hypothetical protein WJX73_002152 [Symbiochloris irregularis]|uniref:Uncharacterized protein n=1 Tax=Symbiochloris irregularis TaxID=706552 RepID=A0AAW1NU29_9CHLO